MKIVINPPFENITSFVKEIPSIFDSTGTQIFKGRNILKRYQVNGHSLIVKRFKKPHIINRIAYITIRSSKAERSYKNAIKLLDLGVSTPYPVAYIEEYSWGLAYSYYISLELKNVSEIRNLHTIYERDQAITTLKQLGEYIAQLHKKGILHKDLSAGNILFKIENGFLSFYLVDINRMLFETISEERGYRNFERLWLSEEDFIILAKAYASIRGYNPEKAIKRILHYKNHYMQ